MARTDFQSVDEYLASRPEAHRPTLELVRATIRAALPGADEVISYQIPVYRLADRAILYFAGWAQHVSLYPAPETLVAALGEALTPYKVAKGTIRFSLAEPVPVALIERIAAFRAKEARSAEAAKSRKPRVKASKPRGGSPP